MEHFFWHPGLPLRSAKQKNTEGTPKHFSFYISPRLDRYKCFTLCMYTPQSGLRPELFGRVQVRATLPCTLGDVSTHSPVCRRYLNQRNISRRLFWSLFLPKQQRTSTHICQFSSVHSVCGNSYNAPLCPPELVASVEALLAPELLASALMPFCTESLAQRNKHATEKGCLLSVKWLIR